MAEGVLFSIAEEILKNLGSRAVHEIASAWGSEARLEKLNNTINTIKDVLLDAEERQTDNRVIHGWLERLSTVVYAADDLFDEVATVASRKQILSGNNLTDKVHPFFSSSNPILFAFKVSKKIKTIRQELDDILKESTDFAFVNRPREEGSVKIRRDQTYSFVDADEVIGRDDDKKAILDLLFASGETENEVLPVIPVVGIGGLGKTTLAQLIYNDLQVDKYFELKLWVCVSEAFDIKIITEKILKSATEAETPNLEMEQLQGLLRKEVGDKKYLLVLDDIWNENREEWLKLRALLKIGRKGSKIIVTTRSREVAKIMGTVPAYDLQGLLEEKSWDLFQKMAFEPGQAQQKPHLIEVGKEIVKKCANVPLAIRTVGSLLYGKNENKWLSIKDRSLANIFDSQNRVMEILKLSYQQLPSPLKNCFAYCALFPEDYEFDKETLMNLWIAEGFIMSKTNEGHNLEELAEDYFLILLQRCFFQDIKNDQWGNISSCKMHDLMHDLALQVAGVNCKVAKLEESNSSMGNHHLSFAYSLTSDWKIPSWVKNLKLLRTFLLPEQKKDGMPFSKSICQELISTIGCLRVLDLHSLGIRNLPSSIGKLIHLRYLNLSHTPLRKLPDSITKLHNLQTLNLYSCWSVRKLPINLSLLKNLRSLDVGDCPYLNCMPSGLGKLTSLTKLPQFIVVYRNCPKLKYKPNTAKLSDLKNLNNLKGVLHIQIHGELKNNLLEATEANLEGKHGLTKLHIGLDWWSYEDIGESNHDESILEGLKPHPNLRELEIYWYRGQKLPSWAMMGNLCTTLPNLVEIKLRCGRCQEVPCFSQLPSLKRLSLVSLQSVEYMESSPNDVPLSSKSPMMSTLFFPSLEELTLMSMDSLKGWWKEAANHSTKDASQQKGQQQHLLSMSFFNLSKLWIKGCPKLISMPLCPNVEELSIVEANENICVSKMAAASSSTSTSGYGSKLKSLAISKVEDLISLPRECLQQLSSLQVLDEKLVSTDGIGEKVFTSISSSLRTLEFYKCRSLRFFTQGLERLTAIEKLVLWNCEQLDLSPSPDEQLPWKYLKTLRSLQFHDIPKLLDLPNGLQHLQNLRSLEITCNDELREIPEWISCFSSLGYLRLYRCPKLTSLPEAFRKLTALNQLQIVNCPGLTERCRRPNGNEWPKIQHIPLVTVLKDIREG